MRATAEELACAFVAFVNGRSFVSFHELEIGLGVPTTTLLTLKPHFEAILRREAPGARVTSRVDLNPGGFEISD